MLKTKKNLLFDIIDNSEFDLELFRGKDIKKDEISDFEIKLDGSPLTFTVLTSSKNFDYHATVFKKYSSGFPAYRWPGGQNMYSGDWEKIVGKLSSWLDKDVRAFLDENNAPDLWSELTNNAPSSIDPLAEFDYESFDDNEQEEIRERLEVFRAELLEHYKNDQKRSNEINSKLDYLVNS